MRMCAWCKGPIPDEMRSDAIVCSVRCRQARHRFTTGVGVGVATHRGETLRLAYADPPYPGRSKRYYGDHPDYAGEVDHEALVASLVANHDGWALSTSMDALQDVLAMCPPGVRVAAWVRGARYGKALGPANSWEPVVYSGGRQQPYWRAAAEGDASVDSTGDHDAYRAPGGNDASAGAGVTRRLDSLVYHAHPRLTDPARVIGAKPAAFCRWMFDLLGAEPQDEFTDVFPGSGGVMRAWDVFAGN